jgi:hypothetical protein
LLLVINFNAKFHHQILVDFVKFQQNFHDFLALDEKPNHGRRIDEVIDVNEQRRADFENFICDVVVVGHEKRPPKEEVEEEVHGDCG